MSTDGGCTHDCSTCSQKCENEIKKSKLNELSKVDNVIAVVSGKGGVGKSLVSSLLAVNFQRLGQNAAILDADITGPSIPKMFGVANKRADTDGTYIYPVKSKMGTQILSINNLLENETDPVLWRGPILAGAVGQFWTDAIWNNVGTMIIDMPPGTGDVPLTVFQTLPIKGVVIVTSPQDLVAMVVEKAVKMAKMMNIPILGIVENMSYFECPDNGKRYDIFGKSQVEAVAKKFGIANYARIPITPDIAQVADKGLIELYEGEWLDEFTKALEN